MKKFFSKALTVLLSLSLCFTMTTSIVYAQNEETTNGSAKQETEAEINSETNKENVVEESKEEEKSTEESENEKQAKTESKNEVSSSTEKKKSSEKSSTNDERPAIGIENPASAKGYLSDGTKINFQFHTPNPLSRATPSSSTKHTWDYDPGYGYGTPIITATYNGSKQPLYCIEPYVQFPNGEKYSENPMSNKHIKAILAYGYPSDETGLQDKYGRSNTQAYVGTFVALNAYLGNYNRSTIEACGDKYVNALLDLADKGYTDLKMSINRTSSESTYNAGKNRLESSNAFTVSLNKSTTKTFKLSGLPSGVYAIDGAGNKITTLNFGQSFKLATANLAYNKKFTVDINSSIQTSALYQFKATGVQTLVGFWGYDPLKSLDFSQTFKAAVGNAQIEKQSEDGVIEGLKFQVKGLDDNTKTFDKIVETDAEGKFKLDNLIIGKYSVTEIETPDRYIQPEEQIVTVKPNETITVTFSNVMKKGKVEIFKTSDYPKEALKQGIKNRPLKGVEFTIYKYDSEAKKTGDEVQKLVTDEKGYVISDELWYGDYVLKETKTIYGFELLKEEIVFKVEEHEKTLTYNLKNKAKIGEIDMEYGAQGGGESINGVDTGDNSMVVFFSLTALVSLGAAVYSFKRKKETQSK